MNKHPIVAIAIASALLTGCPDPKLPKKPPSIPEPKAWIAAESQIPGPSTAADTVDVPS